ncbi:hypothetical protein [Candidatus Parabeggiatoa sp. HSG14]|uniref:hypothetical protein n=1 Tax=Candidatus Parabeggiatoa sp. HSG14 TaxID=3055593 RepID=UPI0025A834F7|nr:hypothetical protein [Thiotrichales bacterium HSG14]
MPEKSLVSKSNRATGAAAKAVVAGINTSKLKSNTDNLLVSLNVIVATDAKDDSNLDIAPINA